MSFVFRCRHVQPDGVGYLDREARCTSDKSFAVQFDVEADAWDFARTSGEQVPEDAWAEELGS